MIGYVSAQSTLITDWEKKLFGKEMPVQKGKPQAVRPEKNMIREFGRAIYLVIGVTIVTLIMFLIVYRLGIVPRW